MYQSAARGIPRWLLCSLSFATLLLAPWSTDAQELLRRPAPQPLAVNLFPSDSLLSAKEDYVPEWYSMITNIPKDWGRFVRTSFTQEKIPAMVGMTFLTVGLAATDDDSWRISKRWRESSRMVENISNKFEDMGDGRPQFGLAAAFAAYGFVAKDKRALRTGSQTVEAILACGTVIQVLKHLTGRESPFVSTQPGGRWDLFPNQIKYAKYVPHYDAYPSGHIATALTTVTVIVENYPEWWWARPVGYTIVGLIGVAMGNTGIHWYSDYPLGLALGYAFGMLAAHPEELGGIEGEFSVGKTNVSLGPVILQDGAGLGLSCSF